MVTLVNRFIPPAPGITGRAAFRLASALLARAPSLRFRAMGSDRGYGNHHHEPALDIPTRRVPALGPGWGILDRPLSTIRDGWTLAHWAVEGGEKDVVLSLTDPPFLSHWLSRTLPASRPWVEWTMDLYPQAIWAALGRRPHPWPRPDDWLFTKGRRPDLRLCLGPGQGAAIEGGDGVPWHILPAGVTDRVPPAAPIPVEPVAPQRQLHLLYAGNLGRAHHRDILPLIARATDPARHRLTVAAHGVEAVGVRAALHGFPHVDWRDSPLAQSELDAADIHIVSLKSQWTHICVPSKAVTALCRGKPVLFFGSAESDVWHWADNAGWRIDPDAAPDRVMTALRSALEEMTRPDHLATATAAALTAGDRLRGIESATVDALAGWLLNREALVSDLGFPQAGGGALQP